MANLILFLLLGNALGVLVDSTYDDKGRKLDHLVDTVYIRSTSNDLYKLSYDVKVLSEFIINLDNEKGVVNVWCDLNDIEMIIDFNSEGNATDFHNKVKPHKYLFSTKNNCDEIRDDKGVNIRTLLSSQCDGAKVTLRTTSGRYEDAMPYAKISLDAITIEKEKNLCLGFNTNKDCNYRDKDIEIFSDKKLTITCTNCFFGTKATVFFKMTMEGSVLKNINIGFKNIKDYSAFVLEVKSNSKISHDVSKSLGIVNSGILFFLQLGIIPIIINYNIPVILNANIEVASGSTIQVGVTGEWDIGEISASWALYKGWKIITPNPNFKWHHVLNANIKAKAVLSIYPSIELYASKIFKLELNLKPTLTSKIFKNSYGKICQDANYNFAIKLYEVIELSLGSLKAFYKKFGPQTLYESGNEKIGEWCGKNTLNHTQSSINNY